MAIISVLAIVVVAAVAVGAAVGLWMGRRPASASGDFADIVIVNAHPACVAVRGSKIIEVGSRSSVDSLVGPDTRVVDANEGLVLPGFVDGHTHLLLGAARTSGDVADVGDAKNAAELVALLKDFAEARPDLEVIIGMGAQYLTNVTRLALDEVAANKSVAVIVYDLHTAWANTQALNLTGLLNPPAGSESVPIGDDGLATGELIEIAGYGPLVPLLGAAGAAIAHRLIPASPDEPWIPPIEGETRETLLRWLRPALKRIAAQGITSVHAFDGDRQQLELYDALEEQDELPVRVHMWPTVFALDGPNYSRPMILGRAEDSGLVRSIGVKFFADGVIETDTAFTIDEYPGSSGRHGDSLWNKSQLTDALAFCDSYGLQVATHCVGDAAVHQVLDAYEYVFRKSPAQYIRRWRIEHIEILHPGDVKRFAELGVVPSMQPLHATYESAWKDHVPESRYNDTWPWRALKDAGATISWSSDLPVVTPDVLAGIRHITTTRERPSPNSVDQRLDVEDAVWGYTEGGAFIEARDGEKGKLEKGMLADLVILSSTNVTHPSTRPMLTICNGRITFDAADPSLA